MGWRWRQWLRRGWFRQGRSKTTVTAVEPVPVKRVIVVSLEDRKLALVEDGQVEKVYTRGGGQALDAEPDGDVHHRAPGDEPDLSP